MLNEGNKLHGYGVILFLQDATPMWHGKVLWAKRWMLEILKAIHANGEIASFQKQKIFEAIETKLKTNLEILT